MSSQARYGSKLPIFLLYLPFTPHGQSGTALTTYYHPGLRVPQGAHLRSRFVLRNAQVDRTKRAFDAVFATGIGHGKIPAAQFADA
jgi:hypothetical protein